MFELEPDLKRDLKLQQRYVQCWHVVNGLLLQVLHKLTAGRLLQLPRNCRQPMPRQECTHVKCSPAARCTLPGSSYCIILHSGLVLSL